MAMTEEQRKTAQRGYQARYQKSAKGRAKAREKMAPGQAWRVAHAARLAETRELANETGRTRERWSDEEDAELRKLRGEGLSYREVAKIIIRSQQAVQRRAEKLGLTATRVWPKRAKPIVVDGDTVDEVEVDELHKFMRRRKRFTLPELYDHYRETYPDGREGPELRRLLDNLLRRDRRAQSITCTEKVVGHAQWSWIGE